MGIFKRRKKQPEVEAEVLVEQEVLASVQTDPGCVREANEDSGRFIKPSDPRLLAQKGLLTVVADGMGGHSAGEVASRMAIEIVCRVYYQLEGEAPEVLKAAFEEANRQIYEASVGDEKLSGMGTTCTALVLRNGSAFAAHVGDSRLYMARGGEVYLMTEDHSAVMEMVKQGIISQAEARHHADKNVILRALGTTPQIEVSVWEKPLPVRTEDQFILCSDGLYDLVEDAELKQVLADTGDPYGACERLIALARERGGHDNITVGIICVKPAGYAETRKARATRELKATR